MKYLQFAEEHYVHNILPTGSGMENFKMWTSYIDGPID